MPIYDYQCSNPGCNEITESVQPIDTIAIECPKCHYAASKVFSPMGTVRFADDAAWLKTVIEVVDKDSKAPHVVEFLRNPTRTNYKAWMKGEKIAPIERGEKPYRPTEKEQKEASDKRAHVLMRNLMQRRRIEVRG
jgi:putative FmdB family regulatory protein